VKKVIMKRNEFWIVGLTVFLLFSCSILTKLQYSFFISELGEENFRGLLKNMAALQLEAAQQDLEKLAKFRA